MTTTRWGAALDAFASCLAEQERLLAEQRLDQLEQFVPEPGLGPLPLPLVERAAALQLRSQALTEQVSRLAAATGRELAQARRHGSEAARPSVYLDQMA